MPEHRVAAFANRHSVFARWIVNTGLPSQESAWHIQRMSEIDVCRENNWLFTGIVCLSDWREIRDVERILEAAKTLIVPLPRRGRGDEIAQAAVGAAVPADDAAVTIHDCIRYLHTHYPGTFSMNQLNNIVLGDLRRLRSLSVAALAAELSPINLHGATYRRQFAELSRRALEQADTRIANPIIFSTQPLAGTVFQADRLVVGDTPVSIRPPPPPMPIPSDMAMERIIRPVRRRSPPPVGDVLRDTMRAAREEGPPVGGRHPRRPSPRDDDPIF